MPLCPFYLTSIFRRCWRPRQQPSRREVRTAPSIPNVRRLASPPTTNASTTPSDETRYDKILFTHAIVLADTIWVVWSQEYEPCSKVVGGDTNNGGKSSINPEGREIRRRRKEI